MALQRHVKWIFVILVFVNIVIMALAFTGGFSAKPKLPPPKTDGTAPVTNNPAR